MKVFASAAFCTTRALERQLHVLGISSPRDLLTGVHLSHLHVRTPDAPLAPEAFASTLGFRSASAPLNAVLRITACGTIPEYLALPPARVVQHRATCSTCTSPGNVKVLQPTSDAARFYG